MSTYLDQQNNHGIMGDEEEDDDFDSLSSSSSLFSNDSSNSSDFMEDVTSSSSSSLEHNNGGNNTIAGGGPLFEMTSLIQQLPFKRGLSKHFNGKSQSFTSLANVKCLEDLAKPEIPCNKKLKSCKSYGGLLSEANNKNKTCSHQLKTGSKTISKKGSSPRGSWSSSLSAAKRSNNFLGNKPPIPPQRSSTLFNQTPLFA